MHQIPMGRMDLHHLKACLHSPVRSSPEIGDHLLYSRRSQCNRHAIVFIKRYRAGPYNGPASILFFYHFISIPGSRRTFFPAGMGPLNTDLATLSPDKLNDSPQHRYMLILPDAQVLGRDPPFQRYARSLFNNQSPPPYPPPPPVTHLPLP